MSCCSFAPHSGACPSDKDLGSDWLVFYYGTDICSCEDHSYVYSKSYIRLEEHWFKTHGVNHRFHCGNFAEFCTPVKEGVSKNVIYDPSNREK